MSFVSLVSDIRTINFDVSKRVCAFLLDASPYILILFSYTLSVSQRRPFPSSPKTVVFSGRVRGSPPIRARTESALASRLSKFLSGCDSFYDEQPLALAIQHQADATARSAQAALSSYPPSLPEASKHQRHDTNKIDRTSCKDNLVSSVPITDVATESSASRKRPRPSGGNRECDKNGGTRRYESGDRGQMDSASSPEKGFADAEQSGHNKCAPGVEHAGPDREGGVCNGHGTQDHDGAAVGTHGPGTSRGLDQQQTDEPHDDEAVAPAFLTPPAIPAVAATVAGVTCGGNGGVPVLGLVAPLSASSSIGSTPSNGSLSPALVIASPAQDGWGRSVVTRYRRGEGVTVACVSSGNFRQTHGGDGRCSGRGGLEEGIYQGKEEVGQSSQSPSPTPPSTREPSPPPLSTQEGSSTVDGDRNEDDGAVYVDSDGLHQQEKGKSETVGAAGAMRGDDIGRHPALKIVGSAVGFLGGSEPEEGAASSGARPALKAASSAPGLDLPERAPHDADLGGADNKMLEEVLSSTRCGVSIRQCGQKGDEVQVQDAPSESEAEPSEGDEDRVDSAVTVEDPIGSVSASAALSETVVGETR